jgi:hypothetical protein
MHFFLSDVNTHQGRHSFLLEEVHGDLFTASEEWSLAHCCARDMNLSAGIARDFLYLFGQQDVLRSQKKAVGEVAVLKSAHRFIFYLVTKNYSTSSCKPKHEDIISALTDLKRNCRLLQINKLAMPRIACGLDGKKWPHIKSVIERVFDDFPIHIKVYFL